VGSFPDYGCCPSLCTTVFSDPGWEFDFDLMQCYCDDPVCEDDNADGDDGGADAGDNDGNDGSFVPNHLLWMTIVAACIGLTMI